MRFSALWGCQFGSNYCLIPQTEYVRTHSIFDNRDRDETIDGDEMGLARVHESLRHFGAGATVDARNEIDEP